MRNPWRGSAFVAAILLLRTVVFASGCGPKAGTEGGKCEDNGCNTYCESGLRCDNSTNTCVRGGSVGPPSGCNFNGADARCSPGQIAYQCLGTTTPQSELGVPGCASVSKGGAGDALYCCTPTCATLAPRCGAPSSSFVCGGSAVPEDTDASLACVTLTSYSGVSEYCCSAPDTCFAPPPELPLLSGCRGAETFCTGSATPASSPKTTCALVATDAGAGVRGYCCTDSVDDAGGAD